PPRPTPLYTLSLHDALPIYQAARDRHRPDYGKGRAVHSQANDCPAYISRDEQDRPGAGQRLPPRHAGSSLLPSGLPSNGSCLPLPLEPLEWPSLGNGRYRFVKGGPRGVPFWPADADSGGFWRPRTPRKVDASRAFRHLEPAAAANDRESRGNLMKNSELASGETAPENKTEGKVDAAQPPRVRAANEDSPTGGALYRMIARRPSRKIWGAAALASLFTLG